MRAAIPILCLTLAACEPSPPHPLTKEQFALEHSCPVGWDTAIQRWMTVGDKQAVQVTCRRTEIEP